MMMLERPVAPLKTITSIAPVVTLEQRQTQAKASYDKAIKIIADAESEAFANKEVLMQAYRHLATATNKDRQNPLYPTQLAYLLILIGCEHRANNYIVKALKLDPEFAPALDLHNCLQELMKPNAELDYQAEFDSLKSWPLPQSEADYDRLYDQVESFIVKSVQFFMKCPLQATLSFDKSTITAQKSRFQQLCAFEALVQQQLQRLSQDLDILELENMLTPALQLKKRYQHIQRAQTKIKVIQKQIDSGIKACNAISQSVSSHPELTQIKLEKLYDFCDQIADQLDTLSEKHDVSQLITEYEKLIAQTETVQDKMDDM